MLQNYLLPNRAGFIHVEAPGQLFCGGPQYLKEILFKVKEILLSASCKYVIISVKSDVNIVK